MKVQFTMLTVTLCAALMTGCDRTERGPVKSAAQSPASSQAARTDVGQLPSQQAPQAGARTEGQTPVQGQADARQPEQKQHFDNKS